MEKRTGLFSNGIIWFGVAISVSEIEAGIEIGAASDSGSLWLPLILGHVLGGILLFFVGLIGARVRLNAMETTQSTFGKYGSKFFAALNTFQLLAWVAVLNAQGASALAGLGAYDACEAANRTEIKIVGFDAEQEEIDKIDAGTNYIASIMQLPAAMAQATIDLIDDLVNNGVVPEKKMASDSGVYCIDGAISSASFAD